MESDDALNRTGKPWRVRFTRAQQAYLEAHSADLNMSLPMLVDEALRTYFAIRLPKEPWPRKYGVRRAA